MIGMGAMSADFILMVITLGFRSFVDLNAYDRFPYSLFSLSGSIDLIGSSGVVNTIFSDIFLLSAFFIIYTRSPVFLVLILVTVENSGIKIGKRNIEKGISETRWPARMEIVRRDPMVMGNLTTVERS